MARNLSTYNFYLDGQVIGTASDSRSVPDANAPLTFGQAEGSFRFHGLLDEVAIFNRALSAEEIAAIYAAGTNGMCKDALPPTLLTWPTNQYVALGSSITLTVTASGTEPLSYQWRFHGTNLPGAANSAFSLQPSALSDSGPYSVIVTNAYGAATSPEAVLTVVPPPLITAQPQSQARPLGYPVTLSVRADSLTPLNYQWLKDGTNMPSATNSNYTIATIQSNHIGTYACLVSNLAGAVLSSDATLSLRDPIFNNPEVFETGLGDWRVDGSGWQVRSGGVGGGTNCMAVVASGNYPRGLDTRLISPEFDVPAALENPELLT